MRFIPKVMVALAFGQFLRTTQRLAKKATNNNNNNNNNKRGLVRVCSSSTLVVADADADDEKKKKILTSIIEKPVCKRVNHDVLFGVVSGENRGDDAMDPPLRVNDDLFWLRDDDRKNEEILSYLREENQYTEKHTAHTKSIETQLYNEIVKAIEETDVDVKFPWGPSFEYYVRTMKGKSYPIVCRRQKTTSKEETVVLDVNELAKQMSYCSIGGFNMSESHDLLAYGVDETGYETYRIKVRNIKTGEETEDVIEGTTGSVTWNGDSQLFYTTMDEAHRPDKVWRHTIGTPQSQDERLLSEDDELYNIGFGKSDNGNFLILESESTETNEIWLLDLKKSLNEKPALVEKRRDNHRYYVEPSRNNKQLYILTNQNGEKINFDLKVTNLASPGIENWVGFKGEGFEWSEKRTLESMMTFKDHIVIDGREDGFTQVWILRLSENEDDDEIASWFRSEWPAASVVFPARASASLSCVGANKVYETNKILLTHSSLVNPRTVYEFDMNEKTKTMKKITAVKGFDEKKYETLQLQITSRDGVTKIPVSIAYKKDKRTRQGPLLLEGYGSYGISNDPAFDRSVVPLLDRGVTIAVAHIRGGGELGRYWYEEQGKYLNKLNTFNDFIDCAEFLCASGWTSTATLAISGRSAGGLLMGAVTNMAPDLFRCVVAGVPFVDVMVSMCDPSIPLTTGEWLEWGNPNTKKYYEYMNSYSPMENIRQSRKPDVLITAGLHDPRVAYWESAKYAARMRDSCTNEEARILLKTDLSAGHFSATDRYRKFKEVAFEYAFVLDCISSSST
jgi:oligopeptidase B